MSFRIGEAEIRKLTLKSSISNLDVNVSNITSQVFVYEDLFSNFISSNISLLDGTTLQNLLPVVGGEIVTMDVGTIGSGKNIRKLKSSFVVFKMSTRERIKMDVEAYTLNLITQEQLIDSTTSIHRAYTKPIHEIIKDVVNEYLTPISGKRLVSFEETKGIHNIIATGITASAFIKQLIREAESVEYPSSIYVFYETIEGYHFHTLDGLYDKKESHTFIYDELALSPATPKASSVLKNNISYLTIDNSFNLLNGQIGGQYTIEVASFDPLTKTFQKNQYSYDKDFKEQKYNNKTLASSTLSKYFANPTVSNFIVTDSHRSTVDYVVDKDSDSQSIYRRRQDFMAKERSTMHQYGTMRIHASVPGNPDVIVGQTIKLAIPRADDTEEGKRKNDRLISGKYIVTAVAHKIDAHTGDYATVMECMRKGYQERIER